MVSFDKNQNYGQQKHFKLFLMMFDDALQMNVELGVVVASWYIQNFLLVKFDFCVTRCCIYNPPELILLSSKE